MQHGPALQLHIEHAHAGSIVIWLAELQRHRAGAVGRRQMIGGEIVSHGLVERGVGGVGDGIIREGRNLSAHRAGCPGRLGCGSGGLVSFCPCALLPGGMGQRADVRTQRARPPVDAHQPVAPVAQRIGGVAPHSARPQLRRAQGRVVFQPGNRPLRAPMHLGKAGVHRRVTHLPVDAAHRHVLGQHLVEHRPVLLRPQHPAARRQPERRLDLRAGGDGIGQVVHRRLDLLLFHPGPRPAFGRPEPVIVQRVSLGRAAEDAFIELLDHRRDRRDSCPAPSAVPGPAWGRSSGVSVPTQVLTPT